LKKVKILVFPCGSEIGLEIQRSLKDIYYIDLAGASSVDDHGRFVYEKYYGGIPFVNHPDFISKINELTERIKADFIFPALDDITLKLSEERENLNAKILTSEKLAVSVCRDKLLTYELLKKEYFCPEFYTDISEISKEAEYPVFVKPRTGQGSKGAVKINDYNDLENWLKKQESPQVVCEYLCGEEFTVDCFTDRKGELRYVSCRNRGRIKSGISVYSSLQPADEKVRKIAGIINEKLPMRGVWFFQLKQNNAGEYKLLEIAPRVAGTMCLQRAAGVNLPLLTVLDAMDCDVEILPQCDRAEVDRAFYNNFRLPFDFNELYIDFDDTIIIRGKVNTSVMRLLYQCANKKIPVYLVTKHDGDIREILKKYKISEDLFEKIYHIDPSDPNAKKTDIISPGRNALFLDDSFSERREITQKFNIPAYGVDSVETLIDWRG